MLILPHAILRNAENPALRKRRKGLNLYQIRKYELVMAITPMSNEQEINSIVEKVESYINDNGGDLTEKDNWGIKRLSYPIQKSNEGNYVRAAFSLQASAVKELERMLNLTEEVLLHMVSKV